MKIAAVQLGAKANKEENVSKAVALIRRAIANGAEFIVLPETFNYRGKVDIKRGYQDIAEEIPGDSTRPLMDEAKRHSVAILAGSVCELAPGKRRPYNTSVLIGPRGDIRAKYRKINLFNALIGRKTLKESARFGRGRKPVMATVKGFKAGLSICYDLRFPQLYRIYAARGAEILVVPSVFTKHTGKAHWEVLLRARAIENLCYVVAANQIGKDGYGVTSYGNSMIVGPWGNVLARAAADKEQVIYAKIEKHELIARRKILPGQVSALRKTI